MVEDEAADPPAVRPMGIVGGLRRRGAAAGHGVESNLYKRIKNLFDVKVASRTERE